MFNKFKEWYRKRAESVALIKADKRMMAEIEARKRKMASCEHDWDTHEFRRICKKCERYEINVYHRFGPVRTSWTGIDNDIPLA